MSNIKRLWAVVNTCTSEVIYSSFDYNRAKKVYDFQFVPYCESLPEYEVDADMFVTRCRPVDFYPVELLRFDLCRHYDYRDSVFQKSLNDDLRAFLDFCLLRKSGDKKNNEKNTLQENNKNPER